MCPASITVASPNGEPVTVSYLPAVAAGGPGVTSTCLPASGSSFNLGTTNVTCTAAVAGQNASCTFTVTVAPPPRLEATRFLAFGDSITFGSLGDTCPGGTFTFKSQRALDEDARLLREHLVAPGSSYPSVLQATLASRYTAQTPSVVNEGNPGETVTDTPAMRRYIDALNSRSPEVVLLQEGINDLHQYGTAAIAVVPTALRAMVREAKGRGMQVLVGTLLPEHPNACRAFAIPPRGDVDLITPTNALIRAMAAAEGVDLVDLYPVFDGRTATLLGRDGLHPNEAGYSTMARTFLKTIQQKLENPPPSTGQAPPDSR